ncbi:DUF7670 domain-containing protein [Winogradskyella alexanderae]|uniref:DUF7670 domain-containing protein n=1 Tax=Winogradskyella alexanderae TaxID=2877123 RepID=A0ABS7XXH3_9FLAO|nr:hypothetical protein [Winogradskyella alexanderae]MCA0133526.1 hypothetical protein [Winogradskyella alexanderae]
MKLNIKIIHWLPRIICILAILFISLFALDAFDPKLTVWQQIIGFLMHLIPSFILILFLIIAWKKEYIGGILFILIGLGLSPFVFIHNYNMNQSVWLSLLIILMITIPFAIVGVLFIISNRIKRRRQAFNENNKQN